MGKSRASKMNGYKSVLTGKTKSDIYKGVELMKKGKCK